MRRRPSSQWWPSLATALMLGLGTWSLPGQSQSIGESWLYTLVDGSLLTDDCLICGRAVVPLPMRGTFELRLVALPPAGPIYAIDNINFTAGFSGGLTYKVSGSGSYILNGPYPATQDATLQVSIDNGVTNIPAYFTNATPGLSRVWPMLQFHVDQTNGTYIQFFRIDVAAAPFRELWLSTVKPFQAGTLNPPTNTVAAGDLVSSTGRIVRRNSNLAERLGIPAPTKDLGLKDVDILENGELIFSLGTDATSTTLGMLSEGDVLSDTGRIVRTNAQLLAAFQPGPGLSGGAGLAALKKSVSGDLYFSVQTNFFSPALGQPIQPGDLLSEAGQVIRAGTNLLAKFSPAIATNDYGLTAVTIWPSGEIWFSTRDGFYDTSSNFYSGGDLLSDQGYVVYANASLVESFQPTNSPPELGLDALWVVSDVMAATNRAHLDSARPTNSPPNSLALTWSGGARVVQLEQATDPAGPYTPATPITSAGILIASGALTNQAQCFYRLRQW